MENRSFYNEILTEHNLRPAHKHDLADANLVLEGVNPSCGVIRDGAFVGEGCAISQASADIMLDLVIGKETEEALELAKRFFGMIQGTATEMDLEELEDLDEASFQAQAGDAVLLWERQG